MTKNVNTWYGEGYIATDLTLRHTTDSSRPVTNFVLIMELVYKSKKNQEEDSFVIKKRIERIPMTAWSTVAEKICNEFKKNDRVRVNGSLRTKQIEDKKGLLHTSLEIIVNDLELLNRKD